MANFNSIGGEWTAAKEIAHGIRNNTGRTLTHEWIIGPDGSHTVQPGDQFTYNGPDREALKAIAESGQDHLGMNFKNDPEFLQVIRSRGFKDVKQYLSGMGIDEKEEERKQREAAENRVAKHEIQKRAQEIKVMSGGRSSAGDFIGGFGDERLRDSSELKTQKE